MRVKENKDGTKDIIEQSSLPLDFIKKGKQQQQL
jgi:hypothetical protein